MDVVFMDRSAYEELQTGFNSFVNKMKAMANRGTDKKMGKWLDNNDVIRSLEYEAVETGSERCAILPGIA